MTKENMLEKGLKFPLRAIEKNWQKSCEECQMPSSLDEARDSYAMSRAGNPLMLVAIPAIAGAAVLYGIAEGGRYLYNKATKN